MTTKKINLKVAYERIQDKQPTVLPITTEWAWWNEWNYVAFSIIAIILLIIALSLIHAVFCSRKWTCGAQHKWDQLHTVPHMKVSTHTHALSLCSELCLFSGETHEEANYPALPSPYLPIIILSGRSGLAVSLTEQPLSVLVCPQVPWSSKHPRQEMGGGGRGEKNPYNLFTVTENGRNEES